MKIGKILLIGLALIAGIFIIIGVIAPKEAVVTRELSINAPREIIWKRVQSLEEQHAWSPWARRDKNIVIGYEGTPGEPGSKYTWAGNDSVGEGYQTIKSVEPMNRIEQDLVFTSPWESKAIVSIDITEQENMHLVTWSFRTEFDFFGSIYMFFNDMDAGLGPDFEEGLGYLKALCEDDAAKSAVTDEASFEVDGFTITEKQFGPVSYIGIKEVVKWADMQTFFSEKYAAIGMALEGAGYEVAGKPSAIYFSWDQENQQAEVAAVFALVGMGISMPGFETFDVEPGLACQITYKGSYENSQAPHEALGKHIVSRGFSQGLVIEEYVTDPEMVADPADNITIITYPVKMGE